MVPQIAQRGTHSISRAVFRFLGRWLTEGDDAFGDRIKCCNAAAA